MQSVPDWLYRGYTGHEHLAEFGLINMNARLYDPVLGRMLSPDNYVGDAGSQGFNRYSYANNNPLVYTDPSGNIPFLAIPLIYGAVNVAADAIQGNIKNFGDGVKSFAMGAVQGVLAGVGSPGLAAWKYAANAVLSHMPGINIGGNGFSLSISPSLSFGSDIFSFGANISAGINVGGAFVGASIGGGYSTNNYDISGSKISGFESRASFMGGIDNPDFSFIMGSNNYHSGKSSQKTGSISFNIGGFHASYENDGAPFGKYGLVNTDSKGEVTSDGYRTAAISIGWGNFSVETRMFTGFRDLNSHERELVGQQSAPYEWVGNPEINDYRFGSLTFGYNGYKMGINADWVRHTFQNKFAHGFLTHQAWIPRMNLSRASYEFKTPTNIPLVVNKVTNLFTHW